MNRKAQITYREMLLTQLSKAAIQEDYSDAQIRILDQAALLLWRFDKLTFPISAFEIIPLLKENIKSWLPPNVTIGLDGHLKASGRATYLAYDIIFEMDGNPFTHRDEALNKIISQLSMTNKGIRNLRDVLNLYSTPTIIPTKSDLPKILIDSLYSTITNTFYINQVITCPSCGYPLALTGSDLRCPADPCYKLKFSPLSPHQPTNRAARNFKPRQISPSNHLKINHEFWKTLSIPLMIEDKLINWITHSTPAYLGLTYTLNPNRPGLTIFSNTESPSNIEFVNSFQFRSIVDYCLEHNSGEETWLILPHSSHIETNSVRRMLPKNFIPTTKYSFVKQYLSIKHGIGTRY